MFSDLMKIILVLFILIVFNSACRGGAPKEEADLRAVSSNTRITPGNEEDQKKTLLSEGNKQENTSNLLKNAGFEENNNHWGKNLQVSRDVRRSGQTSAFVRSPKGAKSVLFTQGVDGIEPGDVLEFSGWIKGENISTEDLNSEKGAAIFVQGYNKLGKYIKGEFSTSLTGTFDWTYVKGLYIVPDDVSSIKFGFFLRQKTYGSAWLDDLRITKLQNPPNILTKSNNMNSKNRGKVYIDERGFTVKNGTRFFPLVLFIGEGPKSGNWASSEENLNKISSAGFNTIMSYYYGDRPDIADFFSATKKHNLNVLFSLKDIHEGLTTYRNLNKPALSTASSIVSKFKNEPNLLAWYINDELGLGKYSSIEALYKRIVKEDGNHPVFQVDYKVENFEYLRELSDIIGTDPYPVDRQKVDDLGLVSDWTRKTVQIAGPNKGVWQVIQLVDLAFSGRKGARAPNLEEIRNMTYQALIGGAKGLNFYNFHWLWYDFDNKGKRIYSEQAFAKRWPDIEVLMKEINEVTPVLINDEVIALTEGDVSTNIVYKCLAVENRHFLFFANPDATDKRLVLNSGTSYKNISIPANTRNVKANVSGSKVEIHLGKFASGYLILD